VPAPQHPMLPYLVDLESPFDPGLDREYDPVDLVRYALACPGDDYWPDLALSWLEQGVPSTELCKELRAFEGESHRPQTQRHRARRLRKAATA
jgi:hypothetical protein